MSEPMRDEEWEAPVDGEFEVIHGGLRQSVVPLEVYKAALSANREKDAQLSAALGSLAEMPRIILEINEAHIKEVREKDAEIENDRKLARVVIDSGERVIADLKAELASLRASAGEKPEDAWRRAWSVGYLDALDNVDVLRPAPYVAPPTLNGEKE